MHKAFYDIARTYESEGRYEEANDTYQMIVTDYPGTGLDAAKYRILLYISMGDDPNAERAIDGLIADFSDNPDLAAVISNVEEGYYIRLLSTESWVRENYIYPVALWEKVLAKFPDFFYNSSDLYYFIGCCYYQLGEYENAGEYYAIVLENWPDQKWAFGAERLIESCFERAANAEE